MKSGNDDSINRKTVRELLVKSFSYEELNDFCFDYFPDVYDRIEGKFGKHVIARLLIDYCERHGFIKNLLALIKTHNPYQYVIYEDRLFKPAARPSSSGDEPKTTLKLIFPNINVEDFTPDKQAALIHLLAEELNIREEDITIAEIRTGSTIIILRLPASAARQLMTLAQAGHPVLQDLCLDYIEGGPAGHSLWERIVKILNEFLGSTNATLILLVAAILLTALAAIPWLGGWLNFQQKMTPTLVSEFVFVTATPTSPPTPVPSATPTLAPEPIVPLVDTPTPIPTPSPSPTVTSTPSDTATPTPMATSAPTPTETFTPTSTETFTTSPLPTPTSAPTHTPTPTATSTRTPTLTPIPGDNQSTIEGPYQVRANQLFAVDIAIRNIVPPGVFGAQFKLVYLPDDLAIVEIAPNPELLVALEAYDNEVGRLDFAASRQEDVPNFTEDVVFVTVTFKAKPVITKVTTTIAFQNVKLGAKGGIDVPASTRNLTVVIEPQD